MLDEVSLFVQKVTDLLTKVGKEGLIFYAQKAVTVKRDGFSEQSERVLRPTNHSAIFSIGIRPITFFIDLVSV